MARRPRDTNLRPPFLKRVWLPEDDAGAVAWPDWVDTDYYPFDMPLLRDGLDIRLEKPVTIIVGENGSGKSTLLEAIATMAGFNEGGGAQGMAAVGEGRVSGADGGALGRVFRSAWLPQVRRGWFFRAETFFRSHAIWTRPARRAPIFWPPRTVKDLSTFSRSALANRVSISSTNRKPPCHRAVSSTS